MATYAIGDIQGCWTQLTQLVERLRFNPHSDQLWFVGDLVNRGPDSLAVLRFVRDLGDSARVVLGNHDLYLLAASEGIVPLRPKDTIRDVLEADDRHDLLAWLRRRPLHHRERSYLMVHAGLLPQWTAEDAAQLAREVETALGGDSYKIFLKALFHESVTTWTPTLQGPTKLAAIARVFTRLRTCTRSGETSSFSGPPDEAPAGFMPWFRIPERRNKDATIITGHWAAMGLHLEPNLLAIDTGCVWGRQLTAVRLEDRAVFQVDNVR